MKTLEDELREHQSEIVINIAQSFCGRSPAPKCAADCVLCPFLDGCKNIEKAKAIYKKIISYNGGKK